MTSMVQGGGTARFFRPSSPRKASGGRSVPPLKLHAGIQSAQQAFLSRVSVLATGQQEQHVLLEHAPLSDIPLLLPPDTDSIDRALKSAASSAASAADAGQGGETERQMSDGAKLTLFLGRLIQLVSANTVEQLKQNLEAWQALSVSQQQELEALSGQFGKAVEAAKEAESAARAASQAARAAQSAADKDDSAADAAEAAWQQAQAGGTVKPDELQQFKDNALAARETADAAQVKAQEAKASAARKTQQASDAALHAADSEAAMDAAVDKVSRRSSTPAVASSSSAVQNRKAQSSAAKLTEILGRLQSMIAENNIDELTSRQQLMHQLQVRREEDARQKSDEFEKKVKEAEQMQRTMGTIGKVLGWAIIGISVAAAVFTGGASLALAAVGLALAVGDEIGKAVTGVSFMDKLMQPLMDHVMKPMMTMLADAIAKALKKCGVDNDKAELIGTIMAAVVTAVLVIAAAVVGGSLLKKAAAKVADMIAKQMGKLMDTQIGQLLKELLAKFSERSGLNSLVSRLSSVTQRMRKGLGADTAEGAQLMENRVQQVTVGLTAGNDAVQATSSVIVGMREKAAMDTLAEVKMALADLKTIGELVKEALLSFVRHNQVLGQLMQQMSVASQTEAQAGKLILRNTQAI